MQTSLHFTLFFYVLTKTHNNDNFKVEFVKAQTSYPIIFVQILDESSQKRNIGVLLIMEKRPSIKFKQRGL